jgi:hypothetical protein
LVTPRRASSRSAYEPSWRIKSCYTTQITGDPGVYNKHTIFPKPGVDLSNPADFASIGMTVTGMPALAAIAGVVGAASGLMTSADLPLRGFAGLFRRELRVFARPIARVTSICPECSPCKPRCDSDVTFPEPSVLNVSRTTDRQLRCDASWR